MTRSLAGIRIALATDTWSPQLNGVTRTLARLVREARARGAEVRVYAPHDPAGRPDSSVRTFRSRAFWAYPQLRMSWPSADAVQADWVEWRPDLVHVATPFGVGLAARRAALREELPLVSSYHTSFSAYASFYRLSWLSAPGWHFQRWFHNGGSRTWCPTRAIADELTSHGFRGVGLWGRGVDPAAFSPAFRSPSFRRSHGVRDDELLIAYVGRLAREKGLDVLLREVRMFRASSPTPVRLMLVGDGPYESRCRAEAPPGTLFTGTLSGHELAAAFASADLFAFPSLTDTFGNVVLEAMASGVPVVAADCPVTRELAGAGAGYFFDAAEPGSLQRLLSRLAKSPDAMQATGAQGRLQAEQRSWEAVFDRLFGEYLDIIAEHRRADTGSGDEAWIPASAGVVALP